MTLSSSPGESKVQKEQRIAGRALDREIATKVMGWTPIDAKYLTQLMSPPSDWGNRGTGFVWFGGTRACEVPHFSTLIADAWLVVEKMRAAGFCFSLEDRDSGSKAGLHDATFDRGYDGKHFEVCESAAAATDSLAICLAALRALENAPSSSVPSTGGEL